MTEEDLLKIKLSKPKKVNNTPMDPHSQLKMQIEKGVHLNRVEVKTDSKITLQDKSYLSMALAHALDQRRIDIGRDQSDGEEEDDSWN